MFEYVLRYQWKIIMIPKAFLYMTWVHVSFAVQVQWPDAFFLPFQNASGRKKHTSVHSAMHFCSMGLHVVVPGLIELTSRNKFVQRIYVHVHVRIFLNRKMFVHPCYAFIYNKKNTRKLKQFRDMETGKKTFFKTTFVFKSLTCFTSVVDFAWRVEHTQPTQACFDAAVVAIPCARHGQKPQQHVSRHMPLTTNGNWVPRMVGKLTILIPWPGCKIYVRESNMKNMFGTCLEREEFHDECWDCGPNSHCNPPSVQPVNTLKSLCCVMTQFLLLAIFARCLWRFLCSDGRMEISWDIHNSETIFCLTRLTFFGGWYQPHVQIVVSLSWIHICLFVSKFRLHLACWSSPCSSFFGDLIHESGI